MTIKELSEKLEKEMKSKELYKDYTEKQIKETAAEIAAVMLQLTR